jgi:hypothetical protein
MFSQPAGRAGNHREGTAMSKTAAPTTIAELKTEARTKWNRWAIALADNVTMPAPRDLLDCGIVLGFESPADALERDAKIIAAVRQRQAAIEIANAGTAAGCVRHSSRPSNASSTRGKARARRKSGLISARQPPGRCPAAGR